MKGAEWVANAIDGSADINLWRLWTSVAPDCSTPSTKFTVTESYYLPGFVDLTLEGVTVDDCKAACCEKAWCVSFDYATNQVNDDNGALVHPAQTCWLSPVPRRACFRPLALMILVAKLSQAGLCFSNQVLPT